MINFLKILGLASLFGALLMAGGCGGGSDTPVVSNPSATAVIAASVNPDGTATTGASATDVNTPTGTPGYLSTVSVRLSPNTVITAKNADGSIKPLTAAPSFTFTAPADASAAASGTSGVPVPTGFTTLASTSGAVDVQITGAASATFDPAITITMPVPGKAVGSVIKVYSVAGTTYTLIDNPSNPLGWPVTTAGFVSFPVSTLSWKVGDPNPDPNSPTTTVPTTVPATTTILTTPTTSTSSTTIEGATTTVPITVPTTSAATTTVLTTTTVSTTTTAPSTSTTTVAPQSCTLCHGIPPATGQHTFHVTARSISCSSCHGAGYSSNTVGETPHPSGVRNVVSSLGWNATTRTCATPGCHGSRSW